MSGHSKWSTIKRQKGAADARRSVLFTKLGNAIAIAAREGADPAMNFKLRLAIDRARAENVPKGTIERAIQRGSGGGEGAALDEVTYEAYGPGGVAFLISTLTDNRNRTTAEVRSTLSKHGATLAAAGSVSWMFHLKGRVYLDRARSGALTEELELALIDAGAEDLNESADGTIVTCAPAALEPIRALLTERGLSPTDTRQEFVAERQIVPPADAAKTVTRLEEALEEIAEVQNVATNAKDEDA